MSERKYKLEGVYESAEESGDYDPQEEMGSRQNYSMMKKEYIQNKQPSNLTIKIGQESSKIYKEVHSESS